MARILSIDGGGIRGLIPAEVLADIESRTGKPAASLFHMIAGTSTGGVLAAGLCRPPAPLSARELADFYREEGPAIFANPWWRRLRTCESFARPEFRPGPLERALSAHFGESRMSRVTAADLLVTAYDIDAATPLFFKSWKATGTDIDPGDHPPEWDYALADLCRATSAAPTFYPPAQIRSAAGHTRHLVDGVVFANNPAMCAMHAAMRLYPAADSYLIVSLGTGSHRRSIPYEKAKTWGKLEWVMHRDIIDIVFDGVSATVNYEIQQMFDSGHVNGELFRFEVPLRAPGGDSCSVSENTFDVSGQNLENLRYKARWLLQHDAHRFDALAQLLMQQLAPRSALMKRRN